VHCQLELTGAFHELHAKIMCVESGKWFGHEDWANLAGFCPQWVVPRRNTQNSAGLPAQHSHQSRLFLSSLKIFQICNTKTKAFYFKYSILYKSFYYLLVILFNFGEFY
jgi:hypothetical protein